MRDTCRHRVHRNNRTSGWPKASLAATAVLVAGAARPAVADTYAVWSGVFSSWSESWAWGLQYPCAPNNGSCATPGGDPEWAWHATVPFAPAWISLDMEVTLRSLDLQGLLIVPYGTSHNMTIEESFMFRGSFEGTGAVWSQGDTTIIGPASLVARQMGVLGQTTCTGDLHVTTDFLNPLNPSAGLVNNASGTFQLIGPGRLIGNDASYSYFTNYGQLRKTGGGVSELDVSFTSVGPVHVVEGDLLVRRGIVDAPVTVDAGARLVIAPPAGEQFLFYPLASVNCEGSLEVADGTVWSYAPWNVGESLRMSGATLFFLSPIVTQNLDMTGGTLNAQAANLDLTVNGPSSWSGGVMIGFGTTSFNAGVTIGSDVAPVEVYGTTLRLASTASIHGRGITGGDGAVIEIGPGALVHFAASEMYVDPAFFFGASILNQGTFVKRFAPAAAIHYQFTNAGVVEIAEGMLAFNRDYVQTDGVTLLSGGSLFGLGTTDFLFYDGLLTGSGDITADVFHAGRIEPGQSAGMLNIAGTLELAPTSVLAFEIGGTTPGFGHDRVNAATFAGGLLADGTIEVSFIDGFENLVQSTDVFVLMNAGGWTGAFANVPSGGELPTSDGRGYFTVHYGPGSAWPETQLVLTGYRDRCPADVNADEFVNVTDLLALLGAWGPCAGCPADVNRDGAADVLDLLVLLGAWGQCP